MNASRSHQHRPDNTRDVAITGLGAITPSGQDPETLWRSVRSGTSAIDVLAGEQFDDLAVRIGGQIKDFDAEAVLPRALARRLSPVQHWAIAAADQALRAGGIESAVDDLPWDRDRTAVIAATGSGPVDAMQEATRRLDADGPRSVPLTLSIHGAPDSAAALISQRFDLRGPGQEESRRRALRGQSASARRCAASATATPTPCSSSAWRTASARSISPRTRTCARSPPEYQDDPTAASRPFDRGRNGFVMSQGAAAILLESADSAASRGATPLAELVGFGAASDAHHPTNPHPGGRGAASAVVQAVSDAGLEPCDIDHINAHATGTPAGDRAELAAFGAALGEAGRVDPDLGHEIDDRAPPRRIGGRRGDHRDPVDA